MMNPDELLDYALGQLDGPRREAIEAGLAADPALAARADRLNSSLHRMLDDDRDFDPTAGLAGRTVGFVAERKSRRALLDFVPVRVPFRWADVAVAAGVVLAGLLTLIPAAVATRERSNQAACGFNLQQLGLAFAGYATRHEHFPDVCTKSGEVPVGWYALALDGDQLVRDPRAFHCPCRGACPSDPAQPKFEHIDYAYHVGYREDPAGQARPISPWLVANVPLLADLPPIDAGTVLPTGNSPNHASRGQNVLFSDLHVQFINTRRVSPEDDDLYLNRQNRPEPGLGVHDAALVHPLHRVEVGVR